MRETVLTEFWIAMCSEGNRNPDQRWAQVGRGGTAGRPRLAEHTQARQL